MRKSTAPLRVAPSFFLCDAHAHMGGEQELLQRSRMQISSMICACTPEEAILLQKYVKQEEFSSVIIPTFGLHPWYAEQYKVSDMEPYFHDCEVIGEIGLDNVWCDVDLAIQEDVFRKQLSIAMAMDKPVILHTKGQERKISEIIKEYKNTYLVHWYSSMMHLEAFRASDCYFSIGPDVWWNQAVQRVAALIPIERLLAETDGMNAVTWAYDRSNIQKELLLSAAPPLPTSVLDSLLATIEVMAKIKGVTQESMGKQIYKNYNNFLRIG